MLKIGNISMQTTQKIAECFLEYFPSLTVYAVNDIAGEDHVYIKDENNMPMFDLLVSSTRKFVFLWYYIHPMKGIEMVNDMKDISVLHNLDFVVKFPNIPKKTTGFPTIVRYGKHPAGMHLDKFIVKAGNPQLNSEIYTDNYLNTYRNYNWHKVDGALEKIRDKAQKMIAERLKRHPEKIKNVRGLCLYAGCAYHLLYPELGFGMRDIDVQAFFSPEWYTNTRCAFTRNCEINEFGTPEYFGGKTRWLDLMWNSFHTETGDFEKDVLLYMQEMRKKSDRWATISQRPLINLASKQIFYIPKWLLNLRKILEE